MGFESLICNNNSISRPIPDPLPKIEIEVEMERESTKGTHISEARNTCNEIIPFSCDIRIGEWIELQPHITLLQSP